MNAIIVSFVFCLLCFVGIGLLASRRQKATAEDYLLSGRDVGPWMAALSAVATNNSGFVFIGMIGLTYVQGLSSMWVLLGWVAGDYVIWRLGLPERIRALSEARGALTIPSFISPPGGGSQPLRKLAALLTVVFLGTYAAAQLTAGSKALQTMLGWDYNVGAVIGAVIVAAYCFAGGIRASIWTDTAQSIVMMGAMLLLLGAAVIGAGGLEPMAAGLNAADPALLKLTPPEAKYGAGMFFLGWIFAGLGTVGQPHIIIRTMTIRDVDSMATARRVYFAWYVIFSAAAIAVGLAARFYQVIPVSGGDAEMALPLLSQHLLPSVLIGLMLAGIFSATISTADSQILACSAAISQDLFPKLGTSYRGLKVATLAVTVLALGIALWGDSVFSMVALAWACLSAGLAPTMVLAAFGRPVSQRCGAAMLVAGVGTVLVWTGVLNWSGDLYAGCPGILMSFAVYGVFRGVGTAHEVGDAEDVQNVVGSISPRTEQARTAG